ncbi:hypothetical protein [Agromyces sp. NPDC058104]|uniref:hypothetical protein n=1 Tax=Agromyces sp. NPDC058104 TaxID=3346342 RepID=UPI0036DC3CE0
MPEAPQLFTLAQVAEILQLDYELVRKAVYGGKWPHSKISERNRRMSQDDIDRVIEMTHHEPAVSTRSEALRRSQRARDLLAGAPPVRR